MSRPQPPVPAADAARRAFSTRALGSGASSPDGQSARAMPIYLTAGFVFDDFDHARERFAGEAADDGFVYTRHGNPTTGAVESRLADLEGGADAVLLATGQAAVAASLLALLSAGDRLVSSASIYEGTRGLLLEHLSRFGIGVDFVEDPSDPEAWEAAITDRTRAAFGESIPNPRNDVLDIELVAEVVHRHGIPLVIDNTLATPALLRPLEHGADVVVHSASKFLSGHGSVLGGAVVTAPAVRWDQSLYPQLAGPSRGGGPPLLERHGDDAFPVYLREVVVPRLGATPSPLHAFLIGQGLETLSLRVERQSANALSIARFLAERPEVASVDYAGLASSPHHPTALRHLDGGFGSVFSVTLAGGEAAARAVIDAVEVFTRMTHLGDVRSLILHPASTTHVLRSPAELEHAGIGPGLLRLSVGIEDLDDLLADLHHAMTAIPDVGQDVEQPEEGEGLGIRRPGAAGRSAPRAAPLTPSAVGAFDDAPVPFFATSEA